MSLASMLWALKHAPVENTGEHVVLIAMADYTGDDGSWCFASKESIAEDALMSTKSVQRHWRELAERGVIVEDENCDHPAFLSIPERYRPRAWRLCLEVVRDADGGRPVAVNRQSRGDKLSSLREVVQGGQTRAVRGDKRGRSGGTQVSPKPSTRTKNMNGSRRTGENSEHPPPARVYGSEAAVARHRETAARGEPGPDSSLGLAREFSRRAERRDLVGPGDIQETALARNISGWMKKGDEPDDVRALMDEFLDSKGARTGDTPLWQRFTRDSYKLRQSRVRRAPGDHFAGVEVTTESRFG